MSRKVIMKSKKAKFTLQQEGFSIHTFEIARRVSLYDFNEIKEYLYQLNKQQNSRFTSVPYIATMEYDYDWNTKRVMKWVITIFARL